jgi:hypothetical protein
MFQFPRLPPYRYGLAIRYWVMKPSGLPHSEIPGYGCTHLTEAYRSVATSFIGSRRQGIHPARVLVCDLHRPGLRSAARALPGRTETCGGRAWPRHNCAGPARPGRGTCAASEHARLRKAARHANDASFLLMSTKHMGLERCAVRGSQRGERRDR